MALSCNQYHEDLKILEELRVSALAFISKTQEKAQLNAAHNTAPYKRFISTLNLISVKMDMLHKNLYLSLNDLQMLDTALQRELIGSEVYRGAVIDLYHKWVPFLNEVIQSYKQEIEKLNNTTQRITIKKGDITMEEVQKPFEVDTYTEQKYEINDVDRLLTENINKILEILKKGSLVFGTSDFNNILLYITNAYEVIKWYDFEQSILPTADKRILCHVRNCICHNTYTDSSCLVEVCTAIGLLVSLIYRLED